MKNTLLFLFLFISFGTLHAQEIDLRNLSPEQRKDYVIQEATRILDVFLHEFLKKHVDPNAPAPTYVPSNHYSETQLTTDEEIEDFYYFYEDVLTDYTVVKNDYVYTARFTASGLSGEEILYSVNVLNNGKAGSMKLVKKGIGRILYNAIE
ncbi:hypothetical protein [Myroides odoratus]|uniref:DUF3828 domain-containing protein n=1 Tax=Myroides odoratus TaxID=256 RepID=A0A9Q6ZG14_MYROD|nr:hypothetical protein [Myroides odoratus]EHQ43408.1 hypothetical protein Myrod_2587 [Myroides odoratus DSM 2801]EKB06074.1 hypothetical protein HMPREF9716_02450 [Myroides odoratus CIP 103059]QQU00745.1 hypothetical protein I6I88_02980 [Myroides odoratus]WQD57015.1 hypothetical protein U0010_16045 [Myroides odoratus]STZ30686.1 Uncharacterised protein [Myroides odoratus]